MSAAKAPEKSEPKRAEVKRATTGVWMVYTRDHEYGRVLVVSPWPEELEARRAAMDGAEGSRVVFVRWGQSIEDALA